MSQTQIHIATILNNWDVDRDRSSLASFAKSIHPKVSDQTLKYIDEHYFHYDVKKKYTYPKTGNSHQF